MGNPGRLTFVTSALGFVTGFTVVALVKVDDLAGAAVVLAVGSVGYALGIRDIFRREDT